MLCSECNKNPAILFYKKIENGKESLEGYCYSCAKKKGIDPNEVLYKQQQILSKDNVNLGDMTKQFETIFKDLAENINLEDIENIDGAITFDNGTDADGNPKMSGAAIPLGSLFSNIFNGQNNENDNETSDKLDLSSNKTTNVNKERERRYNRKTSEHDSNRASFGTTKKGNSDYCRNINMPGSRPSLSKQH